VIKYRKMRWAGHVACTEMNMHTKFLSKDLKGVGHLERPRRRNINIKMQKGKGKVVPVLSYAQRHDVLGEWKYSSTHS
jgi:hypothetical protein